MTSAESAVFNIARTSEYAASRHDEWVPIGLADRAAVRKPNKRAPKRDNKGRRDATSTYEQLKEITAAKSKRDVAWNNLSTSVRWCVGALARSCVGASSNTARARQRTDGSLAPALIDVGVRLLQGLSAWATTCKDVADVQAAGYADPRLQYERRYMVNIYGASAECSAQTTRQIKSGCPCQGGGPQGSRNSSTDAG